MTALRIRPATRDDAARLNRALAALSRDIGDDHAATEADILRYGFGAAPAFHALVGEWERQDPATGFVGAALYSPVFSTVRAAPGVYVSDLWVAGAARGTGLGRRLLAAAGAAANAAWGADFLKLTVYEDNPGARAFYDRLGFAHGAHEQQMSLSGAGFAALVAHA